MSETNLRVQLSPSQQGMMFLLAQEAWKAREQAEVQEGERNVGAAVLSSPVWKIFTGSISRFAHAEVSAISSMLEANYRALEMIIIAAEEGECFPPCQECMEWIIRFGGLPCIVGFAPKPDGRLKLWRAQDLQSHSA